MSSGRDHKRPLPLRAGGGSTEEVSKIQRIRVLPYSCLRTQNVGFQIPPENFSPALHAGNQTFGHANVFQSSRGKEVAITYDKYGKINFPETDLLEKSKKINVCKKRPPPAKNRLCDPCPRTQETRPLLDVLHVCISSFDVRGAFFAFF